MVPPSDRLPAEIASLIERLARLVRAREYSCDLNPAQWEALRYLERCNRFSNNPTALAEFLGSTKGTVSQTLTSLQRKGLLDKVPRPGNGRSLSLELTEKGHSLLANDPTVELETAIEALGPEATGLFRKLRHLVAALQVENRGRSFGRCGTCAYFCDHAEGGNPHLCSLMNLPVTVAETSRICAEHMPGEPRAAC